MHCRNCFHKDVCGSSSPYNDASMCKQFIAHRDVLCGPALEVVEKELTKLTDEVKLLKTKLKNSEIEKVALEREVELLRIVKQTLEMQSGMKFDF